MKTYETIREYFGIKHFMILTKKECRLLRKRIDLLADIAFKREIDTNIELLRDDRYCIMSAEIASLQGKLNLCEIELALYKRGES